MAPQISDVRGLFQNLLAEDPGRPRVTWYGPDHERVELSAKTLLNWVSKTSNLLVEELEAGPGTTIGIDLPVHWRSVVWLLSVWTVGAHAVVPAEALVPDGVDRLDAVVTTHVAAPPQVVAGAVVAVALPALATRYGGELLPGVIDAATEVRLQPDVLGPTERPGPDSPAFSVTGGGGHAITLPYGRLLDRPTGVPTAGAVRQLSGAGPEYAVQAYLEPLLTGGSVVLHHDLAGLDPEALQHLIGQEGVTEVLALD
ncbi:TIGR03089 family protein [Spongisporangium articulatum]|uniref:TIGR03089 family protein n=1 Tax=Spongisporangium articulatum TaxID=3362603 RepID=A0ABW8APW4_9ACTN